MLDRRSCVLRDGRSPRPLRMRFFLYAINTFPHPEECPEGARLEGRNDADAIVSQALKPRRGGRTRMSMAWRGVFPAVTTQFTSDRRLDLAATAAHIEGLLRAGVHG